MSADRLKPAELFVLVLIWGILACAVLLPGPHPQRAAGPVSSGCHTASINLSSTPPS